MYKRPYNGKLLYRYEVGGFTGVSEGQDGFSMVNGHNIDRGEFTYVRVFRSETHPGNEKKWDTFTKKIDICSVDYDDSTPSTDFLSDSGCGDHVVPDSVRSRVYSVRQKGTFYASDKKPKVEAWEEIYLTQCRDQNNRFFFTRLVKGGPACPRGTHKEFDQRFYTYRGRGTACSPKASIPRGNIRYLDVVDGVYPSRITAECNMGFTIQGRDMVDCRDGQWKDELGTCERIKCRNPGDFQNGRIELEGSDFSYESTIRYSCNEGYELQNSYSRVRTCSHDGQWNPTLDPYCERKKCGSPGDLIYGNMEQTGESFGDTATYNCDEGYALVGNQERECTAEGRWTGSVPSCQRVTCNPLAQPRNGQHDGSGTSSFASGSVVSFKCHEGYKLDGAELLRCQLDKDGETANWTNDPPICHPITCKNPEVNSNVEVEGNEFTFGKSIRFKCRDGFALRGSSLATCTASGWDTQPPSCSAKACSNPGKPDNGERDGDNFNAYSTVTFSCDHGYELEPSDSETLICLPNTRWNKPSPICTPMKCPPLARLENGRLSTELFQFGQNITFECFPGYQLQGNPEIGCTANGHWDRDMAQCIACPRNHYKSGVNQDTCKPCPVRSMTLSSATTSIDHCMCETGSSKQDDGTCVAIRCLELSAPPNGEISECEPSSGSQCTFSCNPGYILSGSRQRRCLETGWTGTAPVCTACPANTYKAAAGSQTCIPCPINAHTDGKIGESLESCICKKGYTRRQGSVGGCYDINECLTDNGGCEDRCVNIEGGSYCQCKRPGYELNADGKTCNMTRTCEPLGQLPEHGKTICNYNEEQNGYICRFECERTYFFVSGLNDYVTCGAETDFVWSHQLLNHTAKLPACTKEYFVDTQIPITFDYTTSNTCDEVASQREKIIETIMSVIREFPTCKKRKAGGCGLKYLVLDCKQLQTGDSRKVDVSFEVYLKNPNQEEISESCNTNCLRTNMRSMLQDTLNVKNKFEETVKDDTKKESLEAVDGVEVSVDVSSFSYSRPRLLCVDEGKVYTRRRLCVPCGPGTFLAKKDAQMCTPCPIGTFQDKKGQTQCKKCLSGSTTASEGSDHSSLCSVRVTEIPGKSRRKRSLNTIPSLSAEEIEDILSFLDE